MPNPPVTSPLAYIGVFLILAGIFFILTGSKIVTVEKLSVSSGTRTLIIGSIFVVLGLVLLIPDIHNTFPNIFPPTPTELSDPNHPTPTPVSLIPSNYGKLLYDEKFDQDSGKWSLGRASYIQNGELVIGAGDASSPSTDTQSFSNFIFETKFRFLDPASGFSVYLRHTSCTGTQTGNCSDQVGVSSDKSIAAWQPNGTTTYPQLLAPTNVPELNPNDWNKLTVIANGSNFQVFINNTLVRSFSDNSIHKAGAFIMDADNGSTAFDYVQIYALP